MDYQIYFYTCGIGTPRPPPPGYDEWIRKILAPKPEPAPGPRRSARLAAKAEAKAKADAEAKKVVAPKKA